MIPLRDINPRSSFPIINVIIITVCSAVWIYEATLPEASLERFIYAMGLVPGKIAVNPLGVVTHMFLHGGWFHVISNMWFLWIFGDNVEGNFGRFRYLLFYILAGLGAAFLQTVVSRFHGGADVPMVGASGAISGVLGAYIRLYPRARIVTLIPIFFFLTTARLPAFLFIGLWFVLQVLNGIAFLPYGEMGGVAWFAHIGGFVAGFLLVDLFRMKRP